MREIKFRAYKKATKFSKAEMFDIGVLELDDLKAHDYYNFWDNYAGTTAHFDEDSGDIIMQYTGLKDRNGKEIYEGDIISWKFDYDADYDGDMPIVKTSEGKSLIKDIFDTYNIRRAAQEGNGCEIIGNIHESPELLNK